MFCPTLGGWNISDRYQAFFLNLEFGTWNLELETLNYGLYEKEPFAADD